MNTRAAIDDTIKLVGTRLMLGPAPNQWAFKSSDIGHDHVNEMYIKIYSEPMSDGKLNRWLGWIQCSVVAWGVATLEEMKDINKKHAG